MNSSPLGYAWLLFALTFMQGCTTHTYAARFVHIHTLFLVLASWVLLPFRSLLRVCIPTYTFVRLFFGSNSLLAGVLHLYTHVCISILVFWV